MSAHIHIAVDAMSGDLGPRVVIDACQKLLSDIPDLHITLIGDASLQSILPPLNPRLIFVFAAEIVAMDDSPSHALRHKKNSSMRKMLELLRDGAVDACVSAGNTGALMLLAQHLVGCFSSIERPAIARILPVAVPTVMLDLGASTQATPLQLVQFGCMGSEWVRALGEGSPSIGLLNIGVEEHKGTSLQQLANVEFKRVFGASYRGFVEANNLFDGRVNVIVADGFSGNIALKACEGTARYLTQKIKSFVGQSWWLRILGVLALPLLPRFQQEVNPSHYNGAVFLGLKKTVVKSHGDADALGVAAAIKLAYLQAQSKVPDAIGNALALKRVADD